MRGLEQQLEREFRRTEARRARAAALSRAIHAPLVELVGRDRRAARAVRALRALQRPIDRRRRAPQWGRVAPQLLTGSFVWVEVPPYDFDWTWQSPNPRPFVRTAADRKAGTMAVQLRAGEGGGSADGRAGLGLLQFRALGVFDFRWQALSFGDLSAHTDGWIGLFVIDGNRRRLVKQMIPLWSRDVDSLWGENFADSSAASWSLQAEMPVAGNTPYFLWVWCGATVSASGKITPVSGSGALADLAVQVPFMVIDYHD
jgi:hypothetical protein